VPLSSRDLTNLWIPTLCHNPGLGEKYIKTLTFYKSYAHLPEYFAFTFKPYKFTWWDLA
jgi:hypothetical protein